MKEIVFENISDLMSFDSLNVNRAIFVKNVSGKLIGMLVYDSQFEKWHINMGKTLRSECYTNLFNLMEHYINSRGLKFIGMVKGE